MALHQSTPSTGLTVVRLCDQHFYVGMGIQIHGLMIGWQALHRLLSPQPPLLLQIGFTWISV